MPLHTSTGAPTKAQQARFVAIKETGCVCCRLRGYPGEPPEIHHLLDKAHERRGHDETIGLCPWHHRGVPKEGWIPKTYELLVGPSLAKGSRPFHVAFGDDELLLAEQNRVLQLYAGITEPA